MNVKNTNSWETILSKDLITEAYLIRSQLELEGFEVQILDEFGTQTAPHFSPASGGARIQVRHDKIEEAVSFLIKMGHLKENVDSNQWMDKLVQVTSKIPLLKKLRIEMQLIVFVGLIASAIIIPIAINNIPEPGAEIIGSGWCVSEVIHEGKLISPEQNNLLVTINGCSETIHFPEGGSLLLPAFGGDGTSGTWSFNNGKIKIEGIQNSSWSTGETNLFIDEFEYEIINYELHLKSEKTSVLLVHY